MWDAGRAHVPRPPADRRRAPGPAPALRPVPLARVRRARGPPAQRLRADRRQHGPRRARGVRVALRVAAAHGVGRARQRARAGRARARGGLAAGVRVGVLAALAGFLVAGCSSGTSATRSCSTRSTRSSGSRGPRGLWQEPAGVSARQRVALVHDWLTGMRGGERVLERIARMFPRAPISHAGVDARRGLGRDRVAPDPHLVPATSCPAADGDYRWFLPLFPRAIESLDLSRLRRGGVHQPRGGQGRAHAARACRT